MTKRNKIKILTKEGGKQAVRLRDIENEREGQSENHDSRFHTFLGITLYRLTKEHATLAKGIYFICKSVTDMLGKWRDVTRRLAKTTLYRQVSSVKPTNSGNLQTLRAAIFLLDFLSNSKV